MGALEIAHAEAFEAGFRAACANHGVRYYASWMQEAHFSWLVRVFAPDAPVTERDPGAAMCGFEDEHLDELDLDVPIPYVPTPSPTLPGLAPSYVPPCSICQNKGR
jgi:hypothetical protein